LADLLRPYWKDMHFTEAQRQETYGLSSQDFCLVGNLAQADLAVLPMAWNYYFQCAQLPRARDFIENARRACRSVLSYVTGDRGVAVPPEFDDVWVVRPSGFKSKRRERDVPQPVFFDDPLKLYPQLSSTLRSPACMNSSLKPTPHGRPGVPAANETPDARLPAVGFCGQASANLLKLAVDVLRELFRNTSFRLGFSKAEPQPLYPPALLRSRALWVLSRSGLIRPCFITRSRYRAGATSTEKREQTVREFYENIDKTDYTLCVRGGGNFSKRFYETLAMGRIPLLLDTDCPLPFEQELPWGDCAVRVHSHELSLLPVRVAEHFTRLGQAGLQNLKLRNRRLWTEWLTFGEFHLKLVDRIVGRANCEAIA
jgi:hypothetical protein